MAYEQKDNSGTLFVNDRKASEKHPDRSGTALVDGVEYWVSGWLKKGQKGPFLSLAFTPKERRQAGDEPRGEAPAASDDIPF